MGQYPNSAVLFKNTRRDKDTQPHFRGSGEIDGVDYNISLWLREKNDGEQYLKLKFAKATISEADQLRSEGA